MSDIKTIDQVFLHKISAGIAICLSIFGSLNLKELIEIMGQSKTSTLRYLKELSKSGFIEIDQDMTREKRGIYYRLSSELSQILNTNDIDMSIFSSSEDSIINTSSDRSGFDIANGTTNLAELNTAFNVFQGNFLKSIEMDSDIALSLRKLMISSLTAIPLYTREDQIEFVKIVKKFMIELQVFTKIQIAKATHKDKKNSSLQILYLSTIPIGKIRQSFLNRK